MNRLREILTEALAYRALSLEEAFVLVRAVEHLRTSEPAMILLGEALAAQVTKLTEERPDAADSD